MVQSWFPRRGLGWLVLLAGPASLGAENPVTNGGFEKLGSTGFPEGWERVGRVVEVTKDAHTGERALRFERLPGMAPGEETGLNRAWRADSGEGGAMLEEIRGGIVFWYKAEGSEGCALAVTVIPMSSRPFEDTGSPRAAFTVPREHLGDGRWHEGRLRYDFSANPKVRWVHVGVRLTGGPGVLWMDDMMFVERVGPLVRVGGPRIEEDPERPGEGGTITAEITNAGDEPAGDVTVSVEPPEGVRAEGEPVRIDALPPDGSRAVSWTLLGPREAGAVVAVVASSGGTRAVAALEFRPELRLVSFVAEPFLLAPGDRVVMRATVENRGTALLRGIKAKVSGSRDTARTAAATGKPLEMEGPSESTLDALPPGRGASLAWDARAPQVEGEPGVSVTVEAGGVPAQRGEARLLVTEAAQAPPERVAGALWIRRGKTMTIGEIRDGGRVLGRLPHLGRVMIETEGPPGGHEVISSHHLTPEPEAPGEPAKAAVLVSQVRDRGGALWSFRLRVEDLDGKRTAVDIGMECDSRRRILAFEGPVIYAGDGAGKVEALFPGLEWLVGDEKSSGTQDIEEDHADRIRHVPHPNKVTIPLMAVATSGGTIGLLWDTRSRWDGKNDRPQPIFASPDRFEGRAAHLMGLIAPNVPSGLRENERLARTPYDLPPHTSLRLSACIFADRDTTDPLAAMDAWFRTYAPERPMPIPRGSYIGEVEFSMQAYLESLWVPEEKGWLPFLGGPAIWRKVGRSPAFVYDLQMGARLTDDPEKARAYRRRAFEDVEGALPQADDLGFECGRIAAAVQGLSARARGLIGTMGPDGAWRFDADHKDTGVFKGMDYRDLGPDAAAEVGTCARKAYEILCYARIAGDGRAYDEAARSLRFMRSFRVPRAAQVWEVPVHTPDLLAAADAVDAYVEAYRFSGDPGWLADAKRWARAGLPFIYVWNDGRFPWMRYGSIPVFGASWRKWSWFGVLVQWNGLRYAHALLGLSRYDPEGPYEGLRWREIAVGITHSALWQQSTEGRNVALWPDSLNTMTGERAAWDFSPRQILKNVYHLIGRDEEPGTVVLRREGKRLHVTSRAEIITPRWDDESLRLGMRNPPWASGTIVLARVDRPRSVSVNGTELRHRDDLEAGDGPAWRHIPSLGMVIIRAAKPGELRVVVDGVRTF